MRQIIVLHYCSVHWHNETIWLYILEAQRATNCTLLHAHRKSKYVAIYCERKPETFNAKKVQIIRPWVVHWYTGTIRIYTIRVRVHALTLYRIYLGLRWYNINFILLLCTYIFTVLSRLLLITLLSTIIEQHTSFWQHFWDTSELKI